MAKSKYAYVKEFEDADSLLPHTWVVVRIDGHAFTRFSEVHGFQKPNDEPALQLMNESAKAVLEDMSEFVFAFGESDEYSSGHINNQYNTCYWRLVLSGKSKKEAQEMIRGTEAKYKNELLFSQFNINYNNLPQIFRKGSIVYRKKTLDKSRANGETATSASAATRLVVEHEDIIQDRFWTENPGQQVEAGTARSSHRAMQEGYDAFPGAAQSKRFQSKQWCRTQDSEEMLFLRLSIFATLAKVQEACV